MFATIKALSAILEKERGIVPERTINASQEVLLMFRGKRANPGNRKAYLRQVIEKAVESVKN